MPLPTRILKYLLPFLFLVPVLAFAQIIPAQNQQIIAPYGGWIVATSSSGISKLSASTTPYFANFFATNGNITNLTVGTCTGCGSSTFGTSSLSALFPLLYTQSSSLAQFSFLGLTTTTPWTTSGVAWRVNDNTIATVATGTISGSGGISVTAGQSVIGSGLTISCASCALFSFPFTPNTYGTQAVNSTSTGIWFTGAPFSVIASSTFTTFSSSTQASISSSFWLPALTTGTLNVDGSGLVYRTATSTPTVTAPITYSGTLGQFIGGSSGAFDCTSASGSVKGCLLAADWTIFNNKISSSSLSQIFPFTPNTYRTQAVNSTSTGIWFIGSPLSVIASSTFSTFASTTIFSSASTTYLATSGGNVGISTTTIKPESSLSLGPRDSSEGGQLTLLPGTAGSVSYHWDVLNDVMRLLTGPGDGSSNAAPITINKAADIRSTGSLRIGSSSPEAIVVQQNHLFDVFGNINGYAGINFGNLSAGASASTDIVFFNNKTMTSTYYADCGMNGGSYSDSTYGNLNQANGFYCYNTDGVLQFYTATTTVGSGYISFGTGGYTNERVRIDESGRVGIGSTTPWGILSVKGDGVTPYLEVGNTSNNPVFSITSAGRVIVGVGTSSASTYRAGSLVIPSFEIMGSLSGQSSYLMYRFSADANPGRIYLMKGRGTTFSDYTAIVSGDDLGEFSFSGTNGSTASEGARITVTADATPVAGDNFVSTDISFKNSPDGTTAPVTNLMIDSGGNVGVGTTTPDTKLTVRASGANGINLDSDASDATQSARLFFSNGTAGSSTAIRTSSGDMTFSTGATAGGGSGSTRMTIDSATGDVGINDTTPIEAQLTVNGDVFINTFAAAPASSRYLCADSAGGSLIDVGGAGVGTDCDSSSEAIKHDIVDTTLKASDKLKELRIVNFKYNEDTTNQQQLGFLAEQTAGVDAELVGYTASNTPKNVNKVSMLALLVKGFQEMLARVTGLEAQMDAQDIKIKKLEDRLTAAGL